MGPRPMCLAGQLPPLVGFSPTWEREGNWHTPSYYKRGGGVHLFQHRKMHRKFQKNPGKFLLVSIFSFLPLSLYGVVPKSGVGTRGLETWEIGEISPPYARRRAAGFPIRIRLLPLLCWIGVPRNVAYTVCVRVL